MAHINVITNPELKRAAATCQVRIGPDAEVDLSKLESNSAIVESIRDHNKTQVLEKALDMLERTKAMKNKFSLGD